MRITPIKTGIVKKGNNIFEVISENIKNLPEKSILVIAAKIVSICQGRLIDDRKRIKNLRKYELIKREADYFLEPSESKYGIACTIKNNILGINAGVNECNSKKGYILLPENIQNTTNDIWKFLKNHYSVKKVGVIIADSTILPLRWGAIGIAVSYCGFKALYEYKNGRDLFGKKLSFSQVNVVDALAISAVLKMGEAGEKQPFCIIEDVNNKVIFQDRPPNKKELKQFFVDLKNDPFAPVLKKANWKKGGANGK